MWRSRNGETYSASLPRYEDPTSSRQYMPAPHWVFKEVPLNRAGLTSLSYTGTTEDFAPLIKFKISNSSLLPKFNKLIMWIRAKMGK